MRGNSFFTADLRVCETWQVRAVEVATGRNGANLHRLWESMLAPRSLYGSVMINDFSFLSQMLIEPFLIGYACQNEFADCTAV